MNETPMTRTDVAGEHFLGAIRRERHALKWLEFHRPGLESFVRSLDGGPKARERLRTLTQGEWESLFSVISDEDVYKELKQNQPDVAGLVDAVRGDDEVLEQLHRQKPSFAKLAQLIREANEASITQANGGQDGHLAESEASDVGCLIGEMHLQRGEYHKAVGAFSRAVENEPCADAFEGRARAYQALADLDLEQARCFLDE